MRLGDLVKFVEKHKNGVIKEVIGLVVEKSPARSTGPEKPIYRVRWFEKETPDSWHISPEEDAGLKDLYVISSVEAKKNK